MLVLKVNVGERVFLGSKESQVMLVDVRGNAARIGFDLPRDVAVHREAVWDRVQESGTQLVSMRRDIRDALVAMLPWALLGLSEDHPAVQACRRLGITAGPVASAEQVAEALELSRSLESRGFKV